MAQSSQDTVIIELKDTIDKLGSTVDTLNRLLAESGKREAALQ